MAPTVNGETPSSAFLSHLTSYPVISDSISTFKSNPYGQKSLDLADQGYNTFAKPVIPYFSKPYQYVSPYVSKVDSIGDSTLSKVDSKFPAVKKPTGELYDNGKGIVFFPLRKTLEGKDYVLSTYNSEYKKVGGEGLVTLGKAAVTTTLIVSSDALSWLSNFLSAKKTQAKEVANEKTNS
ncbi:MAG: hypothetical protein M1818_000764 [Claussenomyces sp. TS43310]|nr:MAG: hypothetical protein M1818_000764 [Claussenomyces sp. TS43310]